jgi:hypothetical protein
VAQKVRPARWTFTFQNPLSLYRQGQDLVLLHQHAHAERVQENTFTKDLVKVEAVFLGDKHLVFAFVHLFLQLGFVVLFSQGHKLLLLDLSEHVLVLLQPFKTLLAVGDCLLDEWLDLGFPTTLPELHVFVKVL